MKPNPAFGRTSARSFLEAVALVSAAANLTTD